MDSQFYGGEVNQAYYNKLREDKPIVALDENGRAIDYSIKAIEVTKVK